jgi:para-aminobenzoate synthetase component I
MIRKSIGFTISGYETFFRNLLNLSNFYRQFCLLNSNHAANLPHDNYSGYGLLAGIGSISELTVERDSFESLKKYHQQNPDWLFGYFGYDLKNETANLISENFDGPVFPDIHFFRPRFVIEVRGNLVTIHYDSAQEDENEALLLSAGLQSVGLGNSGAQTSPANFEIRQRVNKKEYIEAVKKILAHIQRGDVYELNYCQEFYSDDAVISPAEAYLALNDFSPMPFSCFYRMGNKYLMCASPERFLKKSGTKIISQPIKGTIARGKTDAEDFFQKEKLQNDVKERAENVMIVDLVRNDLSRTAKPGSVHVEELFGIYSFPHLHQMISTVASEMRDDVHWTDVIRNAFPMGSMTGAPKIRAMQLIEEYEQTKRGLFSGAVGYITPGGDFDFNVVIRSVIYNAERKYLSFMAGSAITANSNPEKEYEECLLKAKAFFEIFSVEKSLSHA